MMEIYKDTAESVELKLYVSGSRANSSTPVTVSVQDVNGTVITASSPAAESTDATGFKVYSYVVNLDVTHTERTLKVIWSFTLLGTPGTRTDIVDVVTPYAAPDEVIAKDATVGTSFTYEQIKQAEQKVRRIIDAYTGQTFGTYTATKSVYGAGNGELLLPARLITLNNITGYNTLLALPPATTNGTLYSVLADGWQIGVKAEPDAVDSYVFTNIIREPSYSYQDGGFKDNYTYLVDGVWGYDRVPTDVSEAACILIQQYLCPDSEYRDRYIGNIRAADWRYEFNSNAYSGTGNVLADQMLADYVRWTMTVI